MSPYIKALVEMPFQWPFYLFFFFFLLMMSPFIRWLINIIPHALPLNATLIFYILLTLTFREIESDIDM